MLKQNIFLRPQVKSQLFVLWCFFRGPLLTGAVRLTRAPPPTLPVSPEGLLLGPWLARF